MSTSDYFSNHGRATKWPFTLYHRPIEDDLHAALKATLDDVKKAGRAPRVMIFGCGLFHEEALFRDVPELLLVDTDDRLEAPLREHLKHRDGVEYCFASSAEELDANIEEQSVDLIIAKEVVEHILDPRAYYRVWQRALRKGGRLWMSTPNYGACVLPFIESTFLEGVARAQGFSRRHIHPNKYSRGRLHNELMRSGFIDVDVEETPMLLALCANARVSDL
ncbi:MAG: methyltransferase domain-containing protein [Deltaproteobacteria bacterium]|nr:methyltransferase domain-containing protein [Deltaproteobacteria bacterium]